MKNTSTPASSIPRRDFLKSSATLAAGAAIAHVVRAVVDTRGQIVTMVDRAYLTQAMPMLVVWAPTTW